MSAKFTLEGSGQGAVRVIDQANKALGETEKTADRAAKASKRLEDQLQRQAQRIKEQIDPQEKLNRLYRELGQHVQAGRLTIDQATAAGVRYRQEMKGAAKATEDTFGPRMLANLKSFAMGAVSIGAAIAEIRARMEAVRQENERAVRSKMTAAGAEAALRETVATDPQRDRILAAATDISRKRNLPYASVAQALEQSYGAGGSVDLAIRAVSEATLQTRDQNRVIETSAGIGDIIQATGIKNEQEAAGYLALVQATSRIKGEKVAGAAGKTAGAYVAAGGTEAAAAAVLSALSVAGVDPEGDRARTAAIQMIGKTEDFFNKSGRKLGLTAEQFDTPDERIALLQGNQDMARQFLKSTTFEAAMTGGISKLLLSPETKELYRSAFDANDEAAERLKASAERRAFIAAGPLQETERTESAIATGMDRFRISGAADLSEERREEIFALQAKLRSDVLGMGQGARARFYAQTGATLSPDEAVTQLERGIRASEIGMGIDPNQRRPEQEEARRSAQEIVDTLKEIRDQQRGKVTTRAE